MADETSAPAAAEAANTAVQTADTLTETAQVADATETTDSGRDEQGRFKGKAAATETPEWRKALGKSGEKYNSEVELAKAHADLQKLLGKAIVPPGEKASDEEKAAHKARLLKEAGVEIPAKPEEYGFKLADDAPAEDKERLSRFLATAHKVGASRSFVEAALAFHEAEVRATQEAIAAASADYMAESDVELRREWRSEYTVNEAIADAAEKAFVDGDLAIIMNVPGTHLAKMLGDKPLKSLPDLKRMFARIGRVTGESRAVIQASPAGQKSRLELQRALMDPRYVDPNKRDPAFVAETDAAWARLTGRAA